jgi:DNA-binding response OmpR family regulator
MTFNSQPSRPPPIVSLFNASDDTVEMVKRMLETTGICCLSTCRFADLKKGNIDFDAYLRTYNPAVIIFDISPPYGENWAFFRKMRDSIGMEKRGLVLTTTNKLRLDEVIGKESNAIEIVGKPYDLQQISNAVEKALHITEVSLE